MFDWLDLLIAVILVAIIWSESKRGFGKALLNFAALVGAVRLDYVLLPTMSHALRISSATHTNEAVVFALIFILLAIVLLLIGKAISEAAPMSADVFDPLLGGLLGIGVAIVLCHAMVQTIALPSGPGSTPSVVASSTLGTEVLTFPTYRRVVGDLYTFDGAQIKPDQ